MFYVDKQIIGCPIVETLSGLCSADLVICSAFTTNNFKISVHYYFTWLTSFMGLTYHIKF